MIARPPRWSPRARYSYRISRWMANGQSDDYQVVVFAPRRRVCVRVSAMVTRRCDGCMQEIMRQHILCGALAAPALTYPLSPESKRRQAHKLNTLPAALANLFVAASLIKLQRSVPIPHVDHESPEMKQNSLFIALCDTEFMVCLYLTGSQRRHCWY